MKNRDKIILGGLLVTGVVVSFLLIKKFGGKKINRAIGGDTWMPPVNGRFTSPFGGRIDPVTRKPAGHNGQDIAVPIGTMVKAPMAGEIVSTASSVEGGNQVVMQHTNGYFTGYAHLSKVLVKKGQHVRQGEVIALSGNTGKHTTGAHLHLTLTDPKGVKIDPKPIIFKNVA